MSKTRAGRLAHELQRTADVERAVERLLRAPQAAEADADLAERGERDAETVRRARFLLQLHAPLGELQRLVVAVLHHRDVRLVAADGRDHVAGADHHREALGLAERRHRLVEPPFLRERDAAQRVDQREVAAIAGGVQRGRRLRDVLADDGRVADVAVAEPELVVGEPDRARIVRALRLLQGARPRSAMPREGSPLRNRQLAVQPPQLRQPGRVQPLALVGRIAQRFGRLADVVLLEPGLGERRPAIWSVSSRVRPGCLRARSEQRPRPRRRVPAARLPMPWRRSLAAARRRSIPGIQPDG